MNKKPRNLDGLKSGMLTYEDAEPIRVRKPEIIMEPVPRRGVLGRIKDRILGPVMKPHAVMVLSKDERERLKGLMKSDIANSCAVTVDDLKKTTDRLLTLARGHHIRNNADGTVTIVCDNPRCKCNPKNRNKKNRTMTKKEEAILNDLVKTLQNYEDECYRQMAFMNEHKFEIEREAIRYKQQAFNRSWLEVSNAIDKIKALKNEAKGE